MLASSTRPALRALLLMALSFQTLEAQTTPLAEPNAAGIKFSPDGRSLIYQLLASTPGQPSQVRIMNLDGTNDREVAIVPATGPQGPNFSPDGSRIAYLSLRGTPPKAPVVQLATIALDGSGGRILSDSGGFDVNWSPDGRQLLFATVSGAVQNGSFGVGVINADGTGLVQLSTDLKSIQSGSWSPDGKRIVFSRKNATGSHLVITSPDGRNARRLGLSQAEQASPEWSPDGRWIAFFGGDSAGMRQYGLGQHLYVMGSDGQGLREILVNATGVSSVSFSPDSKQLLYADRRPGRGSDIFVINVDGTNERALVSGPGTDETPMWSPDGKLIAYQSSADPQGRSPHVFVMNADGTGVRRIR